MHYERSKKDDSMRPPRTEHSEAPEARAARLKERVYVTFTALAVLIALTSHGGAPSPGPAVLSLLVTTIGILFAGFVADIISHATVRSSLPTASELRHMANVSVGALGAIVGPMILLALAQLGVIETNFALYAGQGLLVAALAFFGLLALHRMQLGPLRTIVLTGILAGIGILAVLLELFAHSL